MDEFLKHVMSENCQLRFISRGRFEDYVKGESCLRSDSLAGTPFSSKYVYQQMHPFRKPQVCSARVCNSSMAFMYSWK